MSDINEGLVTRPFRSFSMRLKTLLTIGVLSFSSAAAANLSSELKNVPPAGSLDVIVQFRHPPTAKDLAALTARGGSRKVEFKSVHGGLFTLPAAALKNIAANPNVLYVSPLCLILYRCCWLKLP